MASDYEAVGRNFTRFRGRGRPCEYAAHVPAVHVHEPGGASDSVLRQIGGYVSATGTVRSA